MPSRIEPPHKSTVGSLDANLVALFGYLAIALLGFVPILQYIVWLSPLVFFFMEKNSGFVKFHAVQAVLLGAVRMLLTLIISMILNAVFWSNPWSVLSGWGIVTTITLLVGVAFAVLEILCMVFSYQYKWFKIPLLGNLSEKIIPKMNFNG